MFDISRCRILRVTACLYNYIHKNYRRRFLVIRNIRKKIGNQKGFTLVELMVVISILGILAAIAIPKFSDQTTSANTAKIAADLRTVDGAITMAIAAGDLTASDNTLALVKGVLVPNYIAVWPTPPTGSAYLNSTASTISGTYDIDGTAPNYRTILGTGNHSENWHK